MVRLIPENPRFTTTSERCAWETLRDQLGCEDVLLANLRMTDEDKDHEADLVVLMPDFGCVVLEVKGSGLRHDEDGWWMRHGGGAERHVYPVDQARDTKYALRTYVEGDSRWGGRGHVVWAHGLVTPYTVFANDFSLPDLQRWTLHDKNEMVDLGGRVRQNAWGLSQHQPAPSLDDVELIADILGGRRRTTHDVNADAAERASRANQLTQEQATLLQVIRLLRRVEVRGGAGSGKTVLALQQARELTRGREGRSSERVALLCYSIGLAEHLKREVATWPRRQVPAFTGTFAELGRLWGAPDGDRQDSRFWEEALPARMAELAGALPEGKKFDSIIVDEAQDFADDWWTPLLRSLRDEAEGGLYVYSDENQRIFARFGEPPVALVPLVLDHNLRNTKQIHAAFSSLAPSRMRPHGGDGPSVRFVASTVEGAEYAADTEVDRLLDEGWAPGKVCLISTGHRHPMQLELTKDGDQQAYWYTFWGDEVFYGHVLGCKGLERAAVVLCVNSDATVSRARECLYVGMSRATDELVVVGDPAVIREIGGEDVARRLGII